MSYANDNFASATVLTGGSGSVSLHYDGISDPATSETGEAVYGAGETLWWKWTASFDGVAFFTTRNSPSDDGDSSGLDTKIRVFSDFATVVAGNDDDPDPPPGSYDYNSYVVVDVTLGQTYYIQTDMYGSGEAGTLHVAWGIAYITGDWSTPSPVSSEATLVDDLGSGRNFYEADERKTEGGTWASVAEAGPGAVGHAFYTRPPLRPTYALFAYAGQPSETDTWAEAGIDPPPDVFTNELNPFPLGWETRVAGMRLPAPTLPSGATGWEFEGFPRGTYGSDYRPFLDRSWVTASSIRALLEINRVADIPIPVASADAGWTWITPPVAGLAGPQTIEFRYDGTGLTGTGDISINFSYNQQVLTGTGVSATTIADDSYATYSFTLQFGDLEVLGDFNAGIAGMTETLAGVHWGSTPSGWHDYALAYLVSDDARSFAPEPLTVQMRMLNLAPAGSGSTYQTGSDLGAAPLLYEHATAGTYDESLDTGWVALDVSSPVPGYVYLNYAEQISHVSPEPASLPARDARHQHGFLTGTPAPGTPVLFGSTVSFQRPGDGSTRQLRLRLTYQAPRVRFYYSGTPPTPVTGWQVGSVAW